MGADLVKYPLRPGDNPTQSAGVTGELWERQYLATTEIEQLTGVVHRAAYGYRDINGQWVTWDCYQHRLQTGKCNCASCNLAAYPGTSKHGHTLEDGTPDGQAIDFSNDPRNLEASTRIFYKWGIIFPIWGNEPEPWHGQLDPNRAPLPDQPPIPKPPSGAGKRMDNHTINGITLHATLFLDRVQIRWNDAAHLLWPANEYANLWDINTDGKAVGLVPTWCSQITVGEVPDVAGPRFVVVVADPYPGSNLAYAAYQKPGTTGPPTQWDTTAGGSAAGWFGA